MDLKKQVEELIHFVDNRGHILFIIPPFGSIEDIPLGPHILHSLAIKKHVKADILYLNMILASIIGIENYQSIHSSPESEMLGERLFTRSAYGFLPPNISTNTSQLDIENLCHNFIEYAIKVISNLDYKIIGCTVSMQRQTNCAMALLKGIKELSHDKITIMGGDNCKKEMAHGMLSLSQFVGNVTDYVFQGESEISFIEFLNNYLDDKLPPPNTVINEKPLKCIDSIPPIDYSLFLKQYNHFLGNGCLNKMRLWYETSRGCRWAIQSHCRFCNELPVSYRKKSPSKIIDEIKLLIKTSQKEDNGLFKRLYMTDIDLPPSYFNELLPLLRQIKETDPSFPPIAYQTRLPLELSTLITLKKAGIDLILPGIETFSTSLLQCMNKGTTASENILLLRNLASVGIYPYWYLIWGFPGDKISDYEEVLRILPLISHLSPPRRFAQMELMRFSPYLAKPEDYRIHNIKPATSLFDIFPPQVDINKLGIYYSGEFPSESKENSSIIKEIELIVEEWKKKSGHCILSMTPLMGAFIITDTRISNDKPKIHALDYEKASEIMISHPKSYYVQSKNLNWAVNENLGIVVDEMYIPIITASPELLCIFEGKN